MSFKRTPKPKKTKEKGREKIIPIIRVQKTKCKNKNHLRIGYEHTTHSYTGQLIRKLFKKQQLSFYEKKNEHWIQSLVVISVLREAPNSNVYPLVNSNNNSSNNMKRYPSPKCFYFVSMVTKI